MFVSGESTTYKLRNLQTEINKIKEKIRNKLKQGITDIISKNNKRNEQEIQNIPIESPLRASKLSFDNNSKPLSFHNNSILQSKNVELTVQNIVNYPLFKITYIGNGENLGLRPGTSNDENIRIEIVDDLKPIFESIYKLKDKILKIQTELEQEQTERNLSQKQFEERNAAAAAYYDRQNPWNR